MNLSKADYILVICLTLIACAMSTFKLGSYSLEWVAPFLCLFLFKDLKSVLIAVLSFVIINIFNNFPIGVASCIAGAVIIFIVMFLAALSMSKLNFIVAVGVLLIGIAYILPFANFIDKPFTSEAYFLIVSPDSMKTAINIAIAGLLVPPLYQFLVKKGIFKDENVEKYVNVKKK
ncbi:MAG: hypothetical protein LBR40_03770 [Bacilli bacterium]|jgi:hypothetical protein|nr:hypothetical protein [Bacilli bacterium]